ncbi:hypothetical protein Tcan_02178 [Toxocara canis]|uniref:Uncharacterized protein n=1 Tax=Toxocara canis TaxID=6265 RepID=A0A0B2UQN2_TOXCA|nr:hypothetical protein Tcan_02178 [Toxocara canis]
MIISEQCGLLSATMRGITVLVMMMLLVCANAAIDFSTCARMDIPVLSKVARAMCINSCKFQNCGTGYCQVSKGRKTCVCYRCGNGGGPYPPLPSITIGKGR